MKIKNIFIVLETDKGNEASVEITAKPLGVKWYWPPSSLEDNAIMYSRYIRLIYDLLDFMKAEEGNGKDR